MSGCRMTTHTLRTQETRFLDVDPLNWIGGGFPPDGFPPNWIGCGSPQMDSPSWIECGFPQLDWRWIPLSWIGCGSPQLDPLSWTN